jgi:hypothetical protein
MLATSSKLAERVHDESTSPSHKSQVQTDRLINWSRQETGPHHLATNKSLT